MERETLPLSPDAYCVMLAYCDYLTLIRGCKVSWQTWCLRGKMLSLLHELRDERNTLDYQKYPTLEKALEAGQYHIAHMYDGYINRSLASACEQGDIRWVKEFASHDGANPHDDKHYPMLRAVVHGYTDVVKYLLAGPCNELSLWFLQITAKQGNIELFREIINKLTFWNTQYLALQYALSERNPIMIEIAMNHDGFKPFDENYEVNRFLATLFWTAPEFIDRVLGHPKYNPAWNILALTAAVGSGNIPWVRKLLADPNIDLTRNDNYILKHANTLGRFKIIQLLLKHPKIIQSLGEAEMAEYTDNSRLRTTNAQLRWRCSLNQPIKWILSDPESKPASYSSSALIIACERGNIPNVRVLIQAGCDINAYNGWPLRIACNQGHVDLVKVLLTYKDLRPNEFDSNAISISYATNNRVLVKLLLTDPRLTSTLRPTAKYMFEQFCM